MQEELDVYQPERIKYLKENNMDMFKQVVKKGATAYEQIGRYVTVKATKLLKLEEKEYYSAYQKCLLMPDMHFQIREADEKTRIAMKPKHVVSESRDELKKIYIEWLGLQLESRKIQLCIED